MATRVIANLRFGMSTLDEPRRASEGRQGAPDASSTLRFPVAKLWTLLT